MAVSTPEPPPPVYIPSPALERHRTLADVGAVVGCSSGGTLYCQRITVRLRDRRMTYDVERSVIMRVAQGTPLMAANRMTPMPPTETTLVAELWDESEPLALLRREISAEDYLQMQEDQRLLVNFDVFPQTLVHLLHNCCSQLADKRHSNTENDAVAAERQESLGDNESIAAPSTSSPFPVYPDGVMFAPHDITTIIRASKAEFSSDVGVGEDEQRAKASKSSLTNSSFRNQANSPAGSNGEKNLVALLVLHYEEDGDKDKNRSSAALSNRPLTAGSGGSEVSRRAGNSDAFESVEFHRWSLLGKSNPTLLTLPLGSGVRTSWKNVRNYSTFRGATLHLIETNTYRELNYLHLDFERCSDLECLKHLAARLEMQKLYSVSLEHELCRVDAHRRHWAHMYRDARDKSTAAQEKARELVTSVKKTAGEEVTLLREEHARRLEAATAVANRELDETCRRVKELELQLAANQTEIARLQKLVNDISEAKLETQEVAKQTEHRKSTLEALVQDAGQTIEELRKEKSSLVAALTRSQSLEKKLESDLEQLREKATATDEKVAELVAAGIQQAQKHFGDKEARLKKTIAMSSDEIERGNSIIARLQAAVKRERERAEKAINEQVSSHAAAAAETEKLLKERIAKLEETVKEMEGFREVQQERITLLENKLTQSTIDAVVASWNRTHAVGTSAVTAAVAPQLPSIPGYQNSESIHFDAHRPDSRGSSDYFPSRRQHLTAPEPPRIAPLPVKDASTMSSAVSTPVSQEVAVAAEVSLAPPELKATKFICSNRSRSSKSKGASGSNGASSNALTGSTLTEWSAADTVAAPRQVDEIDLEASPSLIVKTAMHTTQAEQRLLTTTSVSAETPSEIPFVIASSDGALLSFGREENDTQ